MSKIKFLIILTVLVDVIGVGIVIPTLPLYVSSFGLSAFSTTLLFTVFSLCAFLSSPILGVLSDKFGRRTVLITSILSTAAGWLIFAVARTIPLLFLGRIVDGSAAGNFSTAQNVLIDISKNDQERTHNLGLMGATFGLGFIVGPLLGGLLSHISPTFPFWFSGILAIINALLVYFLLPETNQHINKNLPLTANPLSPLLKASKNKKLLPSYVAWLLFMFGVAGMQGIFALYTNQHFGWGALTNGIVFSGMGIIIALNQGLGLKHFWLKHWREPQLELWLLLASALGFLVLEIPILFFFLIGLLMNTFTQGVLRVVMTSQVAGASSPHERGETLGVLSSLSYVGMAIGPAIAGIVFDMHPHLPFIISSLYLTIAFIIVWRHRLNVKQIDLIDDESTDSVIGL